VKENSVPSDVASSLERTGVIVVPEAMYNPLRAKPGWGAGPDVSAAKRISPRSFIERP
jgi:hypothetical protein